MLKQQWDNICKHLEHEVGVSAFKSWIVPLKLSTVDDNIAKFIVPTAFIGNWVSRNYAEKIQEGFEKEGILVKSIEFNTSEVRQSKQEISSLEAYNKDKKIENKSGLILPSSPLDARFTFSNFVVGRPNELAHAAARRVAETGAVTFI